TCFTLFLFSFSFQCSVAHRYLHSFPTRRSSDLIGSGSFRLASCEFVDGFALIRHLTVSSFLCFIHEKLFHSRPNCVTLPALTQRSEEHTSELQSPYDLVCRLLLEKKKNKKIYII